MALSFVLNIMLNLIGKFWFLLEMEFDLDKALEEVPIHIEDPPFPSSRPDKRTSGFISELPSEEGRKLEHFTKLRPKRNKKQQPSQAAVSLHKNIAGNVMCWLLFAMSQILQCNEDNGWRCKSHKQLLNFSPCIHVFQCAVPITSFLSCLTQPKSRICFILFYFAFGFFFHGSSFWRCLELSQEMHKISWDFSIILQGFVKF